MTAMRRLRLFFTCLLLLSGTVAASAQDAVHLANLTIHIEQLSPRGGVLRLGLYDAAHYADDSKTVAFADVPVSGTTVTVTLRGIAPGTYAIECYQDVNANDRMDSNWLGLPQEPYGFSRDTKPFLSKPGFASVSFTLTPGENTQSLHLQNSPTRAGG